MISMNEDVEPGIGGTGAAVGGPRSSRRFQQMLARDAARAGYLGEGEHLVAPVTRGSRGDLPLALSALGVFAVTMVTAVFLAGVTGVFLAGRLGAGAAEVVLLVGTALVIALLLLTMPFARGYAVVLTDRRVLVFGASTVFTSGLREIVIAAPRGEVSATFESWPGWGVLRLQFPPTADNARVRLYFTFPYKQIARSMNLALAAPPTGPAASAPPAKAA